MKFVSITTSKTFLPNTDQLSDALRKCQSFPETSLAKWGSYFCSIELPLQFRISRHMQWLVDGGSLLNMPLGGHQGSNETLRPPHPTTHM